MVDSQLLARIEGVVRRHPNGIRLTELRTALNDGASSQISESTLIRRLRTMVDTGALRVEGKTSAKRYLIGVANLDKSQLSVVSADPVIALSDEATRLQAHIHQPIAKREPVGYQEDFLRAYMPGRTWYLDEPTRVALRQIGTIDTIIRPAGTFARDILERLLIDLAWASSRLEGNTYSRLDTRNLLEHGRAAEGKAAVETQMILNHKRAIEMLVDQAEVIGFNAYSVRNLHAALSENLLNDRRDEGRLRERPVAITGTTYIPLSIPQKIEELFELMLRLTSEIRDPFEQSFFIMVHLPYLQPFADINKRTSRLAANIPFIKANLCPLSFVDLTEQLYVDATLAIYELNQIELLRDTFVWAYERSARQYRIVRDSLPTPDPIRLRFRAEIEEAVQDTVRSVRAGTSTTLRAWALQHRIPDVDRESFVNAALGALADLHEGNAQRYGLRQSEFSAWSNNTNGTLLND